MEHVSGAHVGTRRHPRASCACRLLSRRGPRRKRSQSSSTGRTLRQETCRKVPASVPRMPTATMSASGRRYRGLSAEERRADQRERLVRAPRSTSFPSAGITALRSKTSCAARARAAPRSTRSSTIAKPRCTPRCKHRCAGCSIRCAPTSAPRAPTRASSKSASPRSSAISCPIRRGADPPPRRHRHFTRGQCAASTRSGPGRHAVRDIWVEYDPEAAASPQATAVAVGCSACSSSRCCTWWRATVSTRRRRTFPRWLPRSSGCSHPPPDHSRPVRTSC